MSTVIRRTTNDARQFGAVRDFFCDGKITASGKTFHIHRILLAEESSYFKALFSNLKEKSGVAEIQADADIFAKIVDYIYTGQCTVEASDVSTLLQCAHMCQVTGLLSEIESYLITSLTDRNSLAQVPIAELIDTLEHADLFDLKNLETVATQMIGKRMKDFYSYISYNEEYLLKVALRQMIEILDSPEKLDCSELTLFQIAKAWIAQKSPSKEECEKVLACIRYAYIPKNKRQKLMDEESLLKDHLSILTQAFQKAYDRDGPPFRSVELDTNALQVGDAVVVMNDYAYVRKRCRDTHVGWSDCMSEVLGREMKVTNIDRTSVMVSATDSRTYSFPFSTLMPAS